jgi:hypothetical protein
MRNVSDRSCRENQNTHFVCNKIFLKIMPFMEKYGRKREATDGNIMWHSEDGICLLPDN